MAGVVAASLGTSLSDPDTYIGKSYIIPLTVGTIYFFILSSFLLFCVYFFQASFSHLLLVFFFCSSFPRLLLIFFYFQPSSFSHLFQLCLLAILFSSSLFLYLFSIFSSILSFVFSLLLVFNHLFVPLYLQGRFFLRLVFSTIFSLFSFFLRGLQLKMYLPQVRTQ